MSKHVVSIILPYYNNWQLTHARLNELSKYAPLNKVEVVLVNDASPDLDCRSGAGWWQKQTSFFPIKYVENKDNLGFGGSHNQGARVASGDIFIFLSNDVVISGKFVEQIEGIIDNADGRVLIGGIVRYQDTGWNTIEINGKPSVVMYPEGWLVACTRDLWKEIGGWDSRYGKFDCEDLDLGAWAIYNDVPLASLNNPNLKHLFGQTVNKYHPDREQYTKKNRQIFLDKWTAKLQEKYE